MGQSISRRVVPRLNAAFQKYENAATKDALDDMGKRQALAKSGKTGGYSDPNAVHGGFRRENAPALPQEAAQEQFLRSQQIAQAGAAGEQEEMPDDLLKFLNDNPLEKTVDRELTSPKVLDSLLVEQEQGSSGNTKGKGDAATKTRTTTPRTRTRRTMPLAESMIEDLPGDISADIAGATGVQRTTNFSTADLDGEGASDADREEARLDRLLRLADTDLAILLRSHGATLAASDADGTTSTSDNATGDIAKQKQTAAETYLAKRLSTSDNMSAENLLDDKKRAAHTSLLANALRYSGVPVLLKDEVDADYVGVWADRVADLERMKLRIVEKEETTLLFEGRAGRAGKKSSIGDDTEVASTNAPAETSNGAAALEGDTASEPPADAAVPESNSSTEDEDVWKEQYMEEMKKIKRKVGSTGPATRKFLEEEAARAAAAVEPKEASKKAE
mmetsp:Transcript_25481/g.73698  ORF Transcript_25481/g.73698 Transcript_25481/m.73698 type:complete len:447 (+) Transcript_25481:135-1475(+)